MRLRRRQPQPTGLEVLVHVDRFGEIIELPIPSGWTVEDIATTLAEIESL